MTARLVQATIVLVVVHLPSNHGSTQKSCPATSSSRCNLFAFGQNKAWLFLFPLLGNGTKVSHGTTPGHSGRLIDSVVVVERSVNRSRSGWSTMLITFLRTKQVGQRWMTFEFKGWSSTGHTRWHTRWVSRLGSVGGLLLLLLLYTGTDVGGFCAMVTMMLLNWSMMMMMISLISPRLMHTAIIMAVVVIA